MSQTYQAGIFTCKTCGLSHLIPWDTIPFDRRKCIVVPCLFALNVTQKYRGYEFRDWNGSHKAYFESVVKPTSR